MVRRCLGGLAAVLIGLTISLSAGDEGKPSPPQITPDIYSEAERIVSDTELVGQKLIAILEDRRAPILQRLEAARLLGKMKYQPAIPVLLKEIHLHDSADGIYRENADHPCEDALVEYGDEATLFLMDDYLSEKGNKSSAARSILYQTAKIRLTNAVAEMRLSIATDDVEKDRMRHRMHDLRSFLRDDSYLKIEETKEKKNRR